MMYDSTVEINRNPRGYYTLYISGEFAGNFDTVQEASKEADQILYSEKLLKDLVSA